MRSKLMSLSVVSLLAMLLNNCSGPLKTREDTYDHLQFSSGGAYHPDGYGEWTTIVDKEGRFTVEHDVMGNATNYPPYDLVLSDKEEIWHLICAAALDEIASSVRQGVPDEVMYVFVYGNGTAMDTLKIWREDATKIVGLGVLVGEIELLIEKYCGVKPGRI